MQSHTNRRTDKGEVYHSGAWPEDFDPKGKKIGLIGAGATAVQITQELGKTAKELTVFLRRPSYCLAMKQRKWSPEEQHHLKSFYPALFKAGRDSRAGFPAAARPEKLFDVSAEEREAWFEYCWERGGFHYSLSGFADTALNPEANEVAYQFWRKKVCERLTDPAKNKIMAPEKKPYYFSTKRTPLEQDYYEVLNQDNVSLHDLNQAPLKSFTEKGLLMSDGTEYEFDAVALATGFDSYSGSMTHMGLKSKDGVDLKDLWADGVHSYLGLTIAGFPNMFMVYTPQAPTALSNGPTIIEAQVETVVDMVKKLEEEKRVSLEATEQAEKEWAGLCDAMVSSSVYSRLDTSSLRIKICGLLTECPGKIYPHPVHRFVVERRQHPGQESPGPHLRRRDQHVRAADPRDDGGLEGLQRRPCRVGLESSQLQLNQCSQQHSPPEKDPTD